jgi:hypothetical protein
MTSKTFGTKLSLSCKNTTAPFHLFLKECKFRFNYGSPKQQLDILKNGVKFNTIYDSPLK